MDNKELTLSSYAQNVLQELRRHVGGLLKVRESDLMRIAKISSVRIIEARDELEKSLNELKENNLITYEKHDRYIIRDIGEKNK